MKDKELEKQVLRWIKIADEDLILAKHAFTIQTNIPYRLIGYHAQQCAEKYLKAFLVSRLIDFPYTHNIEMLLNLCNKEINLGDELDRAIILSRYAIAKRYPGDYQEIKKEEAEDAVQLAELTRQKVRVQLETDGFNLP